MDIKPYSGSSAILEVNSGNIWESGSSGCSLSKNVDKLNFPWGVLVDKDNTLYVADEHNNKAKKVAQE